jgi:Ca-activated chloride channel family protein
MSRSVVVAFSCTLAALSLTACKDAQNALPRTEKIAPNEFRILAGSELRDVAKKVEAFGAANGTKVIFTFSGSIDAVDKLSEKHAYDAAWLSHGKYLQLVPGVKEQIKASEKTMYSRVVLGVKPAKVKELGWTSGKVTWAQVISASKAGTFRFAMTNPAGSNTGFVTLVGVASELSGKGDALQESDIPEAALKEFFGGMSLSSGSSGDLADQFKENQQKADGIINYESVIVGLSKGGLPLEVIVPKEGVITADYPLMLLASTKQSFYTKLVEHLRHDDTQKWLASTTFRTPLKGSGGDELTNELPFPGNLKVVDAILRGFLDSYSKPASSFFVLDVSGSMSGSRIAEMKASFKTLVKSDGSVSGRFSTFRNREHVVMTPFSSGIFQSNEFTLGSKASDNDVALAEADGFISRLNPNGGTSIYSALLSVYPAAQAKLKSGDRTVSIVLFTDGANTSGHTLEQFKEYVRAAGEPKVPVYTIQYGDAQAQEMQGIAQATGGRVFDAQKVSLKQTLKSIRAYQ